MLPCLEEMAHLVADIGEVGVREHVHDAPGVIGLVTGHRATDRLAHARTGTVAADDITGANGAFLTRALAGGIADGDADWMLRRRVLVDREIDELDAVVGLDAPGGLLGELSEVVEDTSLVDDEVWELADSGLVILRPSRADDVLGVLRVRVPEGHVDDVITLADDLLGESERLERLDRACLNAVGLSDDQARVPLLDESGVHPWDTVTAELRRPSLPVRCRR